MIWSCVDRLACECVTVISCFSSFHFYISSSSFRYFSSSFFIFSHDSLYRWYDREWTGAGLKQVCEYIWESRNFASNFFPFSHSFLYFSFSSFASSSFAFINDMISVDLKPACECVREVWSVASNFFLFSSSFRYYSLFFSMFSFVHFYRWYNERQFFATFCYFRLCNSDNCESRADNKEIN